MLTPGGSALYGLCATNSKRPIGISRHDQETAYSAQGTASNLVLHKFAFLSPANAQCQLEQS